MFTGKNIPDTARKQMLMFLQTRFLSQTINNNRPIHWIRAIKHISQVVSKIIIPWLSCTVTCC